MKRYILAATIAASAAFAASPASAVQFTGATGGCFAVSPATCTTSSGSGASIGGLNYVAGSFNGATSPIDNAVSFGGLTNNFGSFTLSSLPFNYAGDTFSLLLSFTLPTGTSPNPTTLTANLLGSVVVGSDGGITIDFANNLGNPLAFNSSAGMFYLTVNDISVFPNSPSQVLSGRIVMAAVPEPATWAMMLLGFGGIGFAMRRRRQPTLARVA